MLRRHRAQRLHVVQAISKLYEDYADVLDHRQHHLAEAFRLRLRAIAKLNLVELADAIYQQRDLAAEFLADIVKRGGRVLYDIVKYRRRDGLGIEMHLSQFLGNGDWMCDVGFAGLARLPLMGDSTELVGIDYLSKLFFGKVGLERLHKPPHPVIALRRAGKF